MFEEIEMSVAKKSQISRIKPMHEIQIEPNTKSRSILVTSTVVCTGVGVVAGLVSGNFVFIALGLAVTYVVNCLVPNKADLNVFRQLNDALEEFYDIDEIEYLYDDDDDYYGLEKVNYLQISEKSSKEVIRQISQSTFLPKKIVIEMKHKNGNIDHVVATFFNKNLKSIKIIESYKSDDFLWKENLKSIANSNNLDKNSFLLYKS